MLYLYVYYKVRPADAAQLAANVRRMQDTLASRIAGRMFLRRKLADGDAIETWMEIYENVETDFESKLFEAVDKAALATLIFGERHVERFIDFPALT